MNHPAGIHPQNPVPGGRCGSFSFLGRNKPLFFIWTQNGHAHPTMAWIRSLHVGSAIVTFHPAIWAPHNGIWQYTFAANVQLAAVPIPAEFIIFQDQQLFPLAPILNRMYILSFLHTHTIRISNAPWESWGHQLQQWRRALSGPIANHNV